MLLDRVVKQQKERAAPARAALEILCRSNQATENIGNTPRSFLRMGIAIDIVKKIAISVPSCLLFVSSIIAE